jgi:hypothetical protein
MHCTEPLDIFHIARLDRALAVVSYCQVAPQLYQSSQRCHLELGVHGDVSAMSRQPPYGPGECISLGNIYFNLLS